MQQRPEVTDYLNKGHWYGNAWSKRIALLTHGGDLLLIERYFSNRRHGPSEAVPPRFGTMPLAVKKMIAGNGMARRQATVINHKVIPATAD